MYIYLLLNTFFISHKMVYYVGTQYLLLCIIVKFYIVAMFNHPLLTSSLFSHAFSAIRIFPGTFIIERGNRSSARLLSDVCETHIVTICDSLKTGYLLFFILLVISDIQLFTMRWNSYMVASFLCNICIFQ